MLVVYTGRDEILVATLENEDTLIREYFIEGGRDQDDYDREVTSKVIEITSSLRLGMD